MIKVEECMAQKIVTFEVAKALKEAGYPQATEYWYSKDGELCYSLSDLDEIGYISCPSYLDAWLWLWREKGIKAGTSDVGDKVDVEVFTDDEEVLYEGNELYNDPEEAIISAIEYLVENNLIK